MKDYIYIEDVEFLKDNILDEQSKIIYMQRRAEDYFIHIVCCQFSNTETLRTNWEELVNNVSEVIQKKLKKMIEIYNIYIVFFQPNIEDALLYNIEQNKYSSRKIVLSKEIPEDTTELEEFISSKLFDLKIEKDDKEQYYFIDKLDFITALDDDNREIKLEQYIEKCAREIMNEKN